MKPERRMNYSRKNQFVWNDMLAALDLKLICAGVAFRISDWPGLNDFSGDFFFRLHLPLFGRFRIFWPGGSIVEEPGKLYLLPAGTPLKFSGITPSTHIASFADASAVFPAPRRSGGKGAAGGDGSHLRKSGERGYFPQGESPPLSPFGVADAVSGTDGG